MSPVDSWCSRNFFTRRRFFGGSAAAVAMGLGTPAWAAPGLGTAGMASAAGIGEGAGAASYADGPKDPPGLDLLGPRPGYAPQIGSFVSELTWMREANGILVTTKGLSQADLDYLFDQNANSIGALMLHLAAAETYYQMNTFDGMKWGSWPDTVKQKWDAAMDLGDAGRKTIKGHDREYYEEILHEVREKTLAEFRKRDDAWFLAVDKDWPWGPTNNYCKWFHVCEHEAHHSGQIAMLRKRLPGAKPSAD
jgi:uncharacterized damage-inducible protein DinB